VRVVGVVGAGVIGTSVAQCLAQTGHDVVLIDVSKEILDESLATLRRDARLHRLVSGAGEKVDVAALLARVQPSTQIDDLRQVQFVIENVTEDWGIKRDVYEVLDRVCSPDCVIAANTSAIPITQIAGATSRGQLIVGMHFMNPVPLKPVVEVVRGAETSEDTLARATALLAEMGKRAIIVRDSPGFVSNRVLMLTINEAVVVLDEGVASAHDIDDIFVSCFGHAMGPLATADLIGLDTIVRTLDILATALQDTSFEASRLLRQMVERGQLGRKSGEGFFAYATDGQGARDAS